MIYSGSYDNRLYYVDTDFSYKPWSLNNNCVVYAISGANLNVSNQSSLYIGSSINHKQRNIGHFSQLNNNKHTNPHLQNAYNKYGKNNFIPLVLEHCETGNCREREQNWLDYYNASFEHKVLFNSADKTTDSSYLWDEERRNKRSVNMKGENNPFYGKKHSEETKQKIKEAHSSQERKEHFRQINLGERNPNYGKGKPEKAIKDLISLHRIHPTDYYSVISPEGKTIQVDNVSRFCKENQLKRQSFNKLLAGKWKHYKQWKRNK